MAKDGHLWPHPKLDEKFAELYQQSESFEAKLKAAQKAVQELTTAYRLFSQNAADTVRMSIMQRDNAEAQLKANSATPSTRSGK